MYGFNVLTAHKAKIEYAEEETKNFLVFIDRHGSNLLGIANVTKTDMEIRLEML